MGWLLGKCCEFWCVGHPLVVEYVSLVGAMVLDIKIKIITEWEEEAQFFTLENEN